MGGQTTPGVKGLGLETEALEDGTLCRSLSTPPDITCLLRAIDAIMARHRGAGGFDPEGKGFAQRLEAFLAAAAISYGVTIEKRATLREPADAQKWHIAHMFYYNSYANLKPAKSELEDGHHVIQWSHISDPALKWEHDMDWREFLRDKSGKLPVKTGDGKGWTEGKEPDKTESKERALEILTEGGIATSDKSRPHGAMVAPGYKGCGVPCKCGGNPSRHTAGLASDVDRQALKQLEKKLEQAGAGTLDAYLKTFGLKRPMPSEPWHIEATG